MIHMKHEKMKDILVLAPSQCCDLSKFVSANKVRKPFDDSTLDFVSAFSEKMLKFPNIKKYPDLVSLAFWMRPANIRKLKAEFDKENRVKVARGLVFHIAPSNVDTIFIYSLFLSLLLGNNNVVRLSSARSERQKIILRVLNALLDENFEEIGSSLAIVTYGHDNEITAWLSSYAKARVIWGGDQTVNLISSIPASANTLDIKFANKYSYAMIDASSYAKLSELEKHHLAKQFVNDSFWFAQQACSSPRTIIWFNATDSDSRIGDFWSKVESELVGFNHDINDAEIINKYLAEQSIMIEQEGVEHVERRSNILNVVKLSELSQKINRLHCGGGIFFEYYAENFDGVISAFESCDQTISYFGIDMEALKKSLINNPVGIDRVVPFGKALDFHHIWDGYNFLNYLTREVIFQ